MWIGIPTDLQNCEHRRAMSILYSATRSDTVDAAWREA